MVRLIAGLSAGLILAACGGGSGSSGGTIEVTANDFAFSPNNIGASEGDSLTITVNNEDGVDHSFTIDATGTDVVIPSGDNRQIDVTLETAGLTFYCRFHPQMTGTIGAASGDAGGVDSDDGSSDSGTSGSGSSGGGMSDDLDY